jgi:hypothetical protein
VFKNQISGFAVIFQREAADQHRVTVGLKLTLHRMAPVEGSIQK